MSFYEYGMAIAGWARAHGAGDKRETTYPTDDEFEAALMRVH